VNAAAVGNVVIAERNAGLFAEISDFRRVNFCAIVTATITA
jgi:hypothetical protein